MQIKIGSQKNRLDMGLREIESKYESILVYHPKVYERKVYEPKVYESKKFQGIQAKGIRILK